MARIKLSELKGEIFLLYKVENQTLDNVMRQVETKYDAHFTRRQYRRKLEEWGYRKNLKKSIVAKILRVQAKQRRSEVRRSTFYVGQDQVDESRLAQYQKRSNVMLLRDESINRPDNQDDQVVQRWILDPMQATLRLDTIDIPDRMLFHIESMIRKSFLTKTWIFVHNDWLIKSSDNGDMDRNRIMHFRSGIDRGCEMARAGQGKKAVQQWCFAAAQLEDLLKSRYHDIIPNLICKLNDLVDQGFLDVANMMIAQISRLCGIYQPAGYPVASILEHLFRIDLSLLGGFETRIMELFQNLFSHYVGEQCYNTFVMQINHGRRLIERDRWNDIESAFPSLETMDDRYGPTNCRSLDVLRTRIEMLFHRGQHQQLLTEASMLNRRADMKEKDPWQRHYFKIKALYYGGRAHTYLGNHESARHWLSSALLLEHDFSQDLNETSEFIAEKASMQEVLEALDSWSISG